MSKREHIVETAMDLFYEHGFHATGVEKIIKTAGVSKKTLYHHFRSKEELVLAALRRRDELFRNMIVKATQRQTADPKHQLLAVFDAYGEWFSGHDFQGCMFINVSAEYGDENDPCRKLGREHMQLCLHYVTDIAKCAGAKDPDELASRICLLLQGAVVEAHVSRHKKAHERARDMAEIFVQRAFA